MVNRIKGPALSEKRFDKDLDDGVTQLKGHGRTRVGQDDEEIIRVTVLGFVAEGLGCQTRQYHKVK